MHHYNNDHNTTSAREIVPFIIEQLSFKPKSVIDFGCGLGQWLKVFKDFGTETVLGIDGEHVPNERKMIHDITEFKTFDLNNITNLKLSTKFDLAISFEVAEHLNETRAFEFIYALTQSSDIVIFSAAIPGQTGENHFNEQSLNYWVKIFSDLNFICYDIFRIKFWNNEKVNWWYRQNMLLFASRSLKLDKLPVFNGNEYIHPKLFEIYVSHFMTKNVNSLPILNAINNSKDSFLKKIKSKVTKILK